MSTVLLEQFIRGDAFAATISVDQYHRMIDAGALPETSGIELLDGYLVRKDRRDSPQDSIMTHGPGHTTTVQRLFRILDRLMEPGGGHARAQQPVSLSPRDEPEPDITVVRGIDDDYDHRHPDAADVVLLVEVSVTSLRIDRETKLPLYATAGIPEYWIVDVNSRCVEVCRNPDATTGSYRTRQIFSEHAAIPLSVSGHAIELRPVDFLPGARRQGA